MTSPEGLVRAALRRLHADRSLDLDHAESVVGAILDGEGDDTEIAALLAMIQAHGLTPVTMAGAVRAVRARMRSLNVPNHLRPLLDTCGTGGDSAGTFNISTATAIVVAACGVRVAKHGNRSATSRSGSSDVLTELGIAIEASPETLVRCLEEAHIAYLHAPAFHPALKRLAPIRARLPFPTLFNWVGPLANPARPEFQVIGSPDLARRDLLAATLATLAAPYPTRTALLTSDDGLDEFSTAATCRLIRLNRHTMEKEHVYSCQSFGLSPSAVADLRADGPAESARLIRTILDGTAGAARDVVVANAAIALLVTGKTDEARDAAERAAAAIDSGAAKNTLAVWVKLSQSASPSQS